MTPMPRTLRRPPFWLGLAIAIGMHLKNGWWLDASMSVWQMIVVLSAAAFIVCVTTAEPMRPARAAELWGGFMLTSIVILMVFLGGGNLFPIVIAFASGLSAFAVGAGFILGSLVQMFRAQRS